MCDKWFTDPQYSHGFLVPLFAFYLLWRRVDYLEGATFEPTPWGLVFVLAGLGLHLAGGHFYVDWVGMFSLLPVLAGLFLCMGGRPALAWAWPSIAFLLFMLPLPYRLEVSLSLPLRRLATLGSTYVLQMLGLPAIAEHNVILIEDARIGVVEACNGLGMLMTFLALATAVAILLRRPALDKAVIVLSAVPIALIANIVRITLTGVLLVLVGDEFANIVFHNLAGWLMMPLALGLLWIELRVLDRLLLKLEPEDLSPLFVAPVPGPTRTSSMPIA
jgi:exosortase